MRTTVALKGALVVGGVMLLAILWGLFGPARKPKGAAPPLPTPPRRRPTPTPPAPVEG